jgi:3-deoxy-D-manno-octulosonic-acid transferase
MRHLYRVFSHGISPFMGYWLKRRAARGKEDISRMRERLGHLSISRPEGKLVWIHAASVGESSSVMPLIERLLAANESLHIVITTGTVSSAKLLGTRLAERTYHQFAPVDTPRAVKRFMRSLKPDAAIWVESEFWPNLLRETHKCGVPMLLINARLSARSYQRWRFMAGSFAHMMRCFTAIYAGSPTDKQFLHQLGVARVQWAGNLKYDADVLPSDPEQTGKVLGKIGDRHVWLASSTHAGEEACIIDAPRQIREVYADILTIIVPRHPQRGDEIAALLAQHKLTIARRSKTQVILPETDVYLADTLGELGIFYRLAGVGLIGGSLVAHGGHNPIEPAQLDCAIVCGPHMENFANIVADLQEAKALVQVGTPEALAQEVLNLLRDHEAQDAMAKRAHTLVDSKRGASDIIAERVLAELGLAGVQAPEALEPEAQEQPL